VRPEMAASFGFTLPKRNNYNGEKTDEKTNKN
jgi:hypothetical protein